MAVHIFEMLSSPSSRRSRFLNRLIRRFAMVVVRFSGLLGLILLLVYSGSVKAQVEDGTVELERARVFRWWYQGSQATPLAPSDTYDCFLGGVGGRFEGGGELVLVYQSSYNGQPYWFVGGSSYQVGVRGLAICVPIGTGSGDNTEIVEKLENFDSRLVGLEDALPNVTEQIGLLSKQLAQVSAEVQALSAKLQASSEVSDKLAGELKSLQDTTISLGGELQVIASQVNLNTQAVDEIKPLVYAPNRNSMLASAKKK